MGKKSKVQFYFALSITICQTFFLLVPIVVWAYTGEKPFWWAWEGSRIAAIWFIGVFSSLFSWMAYDLY